MTTIVDTIGGPEGLLNRIIYPLPEGLGIADYNGSWTDPQTTFALVPYGEQHKTTRDWQKTSLMSALIFVETIRAEGWKIVGCLKPAPRAPVLSCVVAAMDTSVFSIGEYICEGAAIATFSDHWLPRRNKLEGLVEVNRAYGRVKAFSQGPLVIEAYRIEMIGSQGWWNTAWCSIDGGYISFSDSWRKAFGSGHPLFADLSDWHVRYFA